jgi:hypothetical protein
VRNKLLTAFNKIFDEELRRNPRIKTLMTEVLRSGTERDFKTLFFLNQILQNLSEFGLLELEKNFEKFRQSILHMQDMKDVMWKDMLWHYIHKAEMNEIE